MPIFVNAGNNPFGVRYQMSITASTRPTNIVGVRFQKLGKLYHFKLGQKRAEIHPGDHVIVDTKRGRQIGQIINFVQEPATNRRRKIKTIKRLATPRDLVLQQVWDGKALDALITCREKAHHAGIRNCKFVKAEYNFDGSWMTIYYHTENRKQDFNRVKNELERIYDARVELQIIGPRDIARYLGGYGACGSPRCCSTFLTEFSPISIRMAKAQGISLSPQEITGMCGRLRCCLVFEYEMYVEAKKQLPNVGKRIGTPHGEGVVIDQLPIKDAVRVNVDGEWHVVARHEFEPLAELEALKKKAEEGCSKHAEGGCDCGAK